VLAIAQGICSARDLKTAPAQKLSVPSSIQPISDAPEQCNKRVMKRLTFENASDPLLEPHLKSLNSNNMQASPITPSRKISETHRVYGWYAVAALSCFSIGIAAGLGFISNLGAFATITTSAVVILALIWWLESRSSQLRSWAVGSSLLMSFAVGLAWFGGVWGALPGLISLLSLTPLLARVGTLPRHAEADLWGWVFVFPAVLLLIVWHFAPALYALVLSFLRDFNFLEPPVWGGFENYEALTRDPVFWQSLINSAWYVVGTVPVGIAIATIIAILLNEKVRGLPIFRTLFFLPYITALTAAAAVWKWIYNPEFGLLNAILGTNIAWLENPEGLINLVTKPLGLELPQWLAGPSVALCAIMIMSIWHHLGYSIVILLAGLQSIPLEYYEAAELDGASWWDKVRHITYPLLTPTTFFLAITGLIGAFQVFTQILVLTPDGGQLKDTTTIVKYLYDKGFRDNNYSYASAMAFALFVIVFVMTLVQNRVLSKRVTYDL
jgi:multiple sugar transport system permease protein